MLPAVDDSMLLEELGYVISAGWRLVDRSANEAAIPHLLLLAGPRPHEAYSSLATRLLGMLNVALERSGDFDVLDEAHLDPLLSEDQSRALRILFGVHADYRFAGVDVRRREAGSLLLGKDQVKANTFYKTHEEGAKRMALECLRVRYGQAQLQSQRSYESVRRDVSVQVGANRRIRSIRMDNAYRSGVDNLDFVRNWFQLEEPEFVKGIRIRHLVGVIDHVLERRQHGAYRLTFRLPEPVAAGAVFAWSYERSYDYVESAPPPREDRVGISGRNDAYQVAMTVRFDCDPPPAIWRYSRRKTLFSIDPDPECRLVPDDRGQVGIPETKDTSALRVYGIAWRWTIEPAWPDTPDA